MPEPITHVPCISVVGRSNSGKTTLLEKLIPAIVARGLRVGVIKHVAHRFEIDYPGKDTYRHFAAGAAQVLIASEEKLAFQKRLSQPMALAEICKSYFPDVDLILTEGHKGGPMPKIEVFRGLVHAEPACAHDESCIALVTNKPITADCPIFGFGQIEKLVDLILGLMDRSPGS